MGELIHPNESSVLVMQISTHGLELCLESACMEYVPEAQQIPTTCLLIDGKRIDFTTYWSVLTQTGSNELQLTEVKLPKLACAGAYQESTIQATLEVCLISETAFFSISCVVEYFRSLAMTGSTKLEVQVQVRQATERPI